MYVASRQQAAGWLLLLLVQAAKVHKNKKKRIKITNTYTQAKVYRIL